MQPSSYPINTIFLWTGGSHGGVLQVALRPDAPTSLEDLQEHLRGAFRDNFPDAQFSFEPGDIVSRIMNFGAPTPVEVAVMGPDFTASRAFATKVRNEFARIPSLRDVQFGQTLDYPAIQVNVNRQLAGQLGVTVDQVGRSFAAAQIPFSVAAYPGESFFGNVARVAQTVDVNTRTMAVELDVTNLDGALRQALSARCAGAFDGQDRRCSFPTRAWRRQRAAPL